MKYIWMFCCMLCMGACSDATVEEPKKVPDTPSTGEIGGNKEDLNSFVSDAELNKIRLGFDLRRDQGFENLRGKELKRGEVQGSISASGVPYYRALSYSLIDFAAKCFWLEEKNQEANDALWENCEIYVDKLNVIRDGDSFYWPGDVLCRIVEYWGSKGTKKAGLLKKNVEDQILKMMFQYVSDMSKVKESMQIDPWVYSVSAQTDVNQTWDVEGSENHHVMRFYTKWHFSKLLMASDAYKNQRYNDGYNAAQHYEAWTKYIKYYLKERARKGLFVEFANELYVQEPLKSFITCHDFGDAEMKELTRKFLDLYWATWAQEQLNGVRGGSMARVYQGLRSMRGDTHFRKLAWYNLGITGASEIKENIFSFIVSDYRMPDVVMDIALDTKGKGSYEVVQRRLGLAKEGYYSPLPFYRLNTVEGVVRYSYCTAEFVMGTFHCDALPENNWTMISSQNRWLGVIFAGDHSSRIYPQCAPSTGQRGVYNQHWGAQSKGCMIFQKLMNGTHSKYAEKMRVWVSNNGLEKSVEKEGWLFCSYAGAYAAIRYVSGGHTFEVVNEAGLWSGRWMVGKDQYAPGIIEVARKSDFTNFEAFQEAILSLELKVTATQVVHKTLYGDEMKFYSDYSKRAEVNGSTISLQPTKVMDSPFIYSDYNSGKYTIRKAGRKLELDFN